MGASVRDVSASAVRVVCDGSQRRLRATKLPLSRIKCREMIRVVLTDARGGPAHSPFYGSPRGPEQPRRPGGCADSGARRRFDPSRFPVSLEPDRPLAQRTGNPVDEACLASTSKSVKQRSTTSPRPLGSQSCNGPQTSAPRGPRRPNRDAERRLSHATRFSAESGNRSR
jgi:hypothetical protein